MESFDEFSMKINEIYEDEKDIGKIAKEMKCRRAEVIEALALSDERAVYLDD